MTPTNDSPVSSAEVAAAREISARAPRRRWTAQQRHETLTGFASCGLTQAEFCRRAGLSAATFSSWRRKTTHAGDGAAAAVGGFARVQVASAFVATTTQAAIVVQVDDGLRVTRWRARRASGWRPGCPTCAADSTACTR
jgi:transposase-like protein